MSLTIRRLRVEGTKRPLGLDTLRPRFSWLLESEQTAQMQSAYRILVASGEEPLRRGEADVWDSGKVESDRSVQIVYEGAPLESGKVYYWKVQVWDRSGEASDWSGIEYWSMGLLGQSEWKSSWIGKTMDSEAELPPALYLRKEFTVDRPVRRATLYSTALGVYEPHLNGSQVGDHRFAPGWTDYNIRTQYQTFDVTGSVRIGANALGAILGTGWYAGHVGMMGRQIYGTSPRLLMQLELEYEDGKRELVISDGSWSMNTGPIAYSDILMGETYDAREEWPGWDVPGFAESGWQRAETFEPYEGKLVAQIDPPVRVTESLVPVKMWRTEWGTFMFDMGQNMVGWVRLKAGGVAGTRISVSHAEMLQEDGRLYTENLRRAVQKDVYVLRGEGVETFEPHFTFHGFRFVEVEGLAGEPSADTVTGRVVHSDTPAVGALMTSDEMVNRLISNIRWGQRGNYLSVPTDCPQRDERLGWTGDAQIFIRTASYNMDVSRFFVKYMNDITDFQSPEGAFPDVAPDAGWFEFKQVSSVKWFAPDNAGWGDAGVIIPWTLYLMYEDRAILEDNYDAMKRWVEYLKANSNNLIRPDYANYGDWLSINADTPKDVLATAYFAYSAKLFSQIAGVLGRSEDERRYRELFEQIGEAFVREYVDETGMIRGDTQTVYVLALYFGLLPEKLKPLAVNRLEQLIRENGNHLSTGFLGVGYLLPALTENGLEELAYTLLHQDTFPSWLYSVRHGATTIWERWDGWTDMGGFQDPGMNSFNHYSLGSVGEWMYRYMAGIDADPQQPGFKHIVIHPRPGGRLTEVRASFESGYGLIGSSWKKKGDRFTLEIDVPVNTTATVYVPDGELTVPAGAEELPASAAGKRTFRVGSGRYEFVSRSLG
ncbi:glycoside hydrolase family 78 protein [Paenibacillus hamazuiensis]|uniref:glycoside hydrolase family 78 protein n=1 Tax=Paenibacillus hamazuiensis TaxID=2936508 RepID=UPI00200F64E2|nr:glycoside hydrolase family 78 protein [Paenibacillus hamazuiensis]